MIRSRVILDLSWNAFQVDKVVIEGRSVGREDSVAAGKFEGDLHFSVELVDHLLAIAACKDFRMPVGDDVDVSLRVGFVVSGPRKQCTGTIFSLF